MMPANVFVSGTDASALSVRLGALFGTTPAVDGRGVRLDALEGGVLVVESARLMPEFRAYPVSVCVYGENDDDREAIMRAIVSFAEADGLQALAVMDYGDGGIVAQTAGPAAAE